jgi:hypothetical protein
VSKARLIITAVVVEGRSQAQVARDYGYPKHGSRASSPATAPKATARSSHARGAHAHDHARHPPHDRRAGARAPPNPHHRRPRRRRRHDRLAPQHHHQITISRATVYRIVRRAELVTPEPKKKPRSSYIRFQAEQPNETWQADFTHWRLADGTDIEILTWLDDHSRYALSVTAHLPSPAHRRQHLPRATEARDPVLDLDRQRLVFTTRFAQGGRTSRNGFETELVRLRVRQKNSRPNHPTTCGKVERFQHTMKRWLAARPRERPPSPTCNSSSTPSSTTTTTTDPTAHS